MELPGRKLHCRGGALGLCSSELNGGSLRPGLWHQKCIPLGRETNSLPWQGRGWAGVGTTGPPAASRVLSKGSLGHLPESLQDSHSAPYLILTASSHERNGFGVSVCYPKANLQLCMVGEECPLVHVVYLDRGTKEEEEGFPRPHPVFDLKCSPHASPPL